MPKNRMKKISLLLLSLASCLWIPCRAATIEPEAQAHFAKYLKDCPGGQVRCLWMRASWVGQRLTIDEEKKLIKNECEAYNFSTHGGEDQPLKDADAQAVRKELKNLPASVEGIAETDAAYISWRTGDKVEVRRYRKTELPEALQRIYKQMGGLPDAKPE